jgi:hypothetical protein
MGGMEFANLETETEYSVNGFTSAWKFTQPNRVAVARDTHENAAPIREIAKFQVLMWVPQPAVSGSGIKAVELPQCIWTRISHRQITPSLESLDQRTIL